jgi:hypothetical protein
MVRDNVRNKLKNKNISVPTYNQIGAALQRLRSASEVLVGPGPVKQRLCDAYVRHVRDIDRGQLPPEMADILSQLGDALSTASAVGGLGAVEATIRKMSEPDASQQAVRIMELFVALSTQQPAESITALPRQLRLVGDE